MNADKIKELKRKNGNKYIKNNDLLWYIVSRLDDLEKESSKDREELAQVKTSIKIFWILLPVGLTIAGYVGSVI